MVVQRRHFEKALAVGGLEIGHLDNIAHGLGDVNDAHENQNEGHVEGKAQSRHGAAQKQAAGIAHEGLGRMVIIDEKRRQAAGQRRRKQGHGTGLPVPQKTGDRKENHDHKGDAAGQAVDAVRQVHSVDAAHDDEGREHQIHDPVDGDGGVEEWDVQLVGQQLLIAHQAQKHHGRRQLQNEFLLGGEALVLVLADLAVIVHKADEAEDQGEQVHIQVNELPLQHLPPPQHKHGDAGAHDEHDAAHGGGAGLAGVPGGAVLPDLLSGFQLPQFRDQKFADDQRQREAEGQGGNGLCHHCVSPFPPPVTAPAMFISFVNTGAPPRSPAHPYGASHG